MTAELEQTLDRHLARFGLRKFRPGQLDVIASVIGGHDCLCIMPTGGGKSLCYQLPSVAREGLTLVVSPLIALMKDQVDALDAIGIHATCINSSLSFDEQLDRMRRMAAGEYDLVYIAPERLRNRRFLDAVAESHVQLLAIDEAHCISEWGHDFRPDYARLALFRQRLGNPQTIALTATATARVRDDIVKSLELREPRTFVTGFSRPNLEFNVAFSPSVREKETMLLEFLESNPGAGIIYASTRKRCEEVAENIGAKLKRRLGVYHAGLMPVERRQIQESFMSGELPIIVATNAFGMGIDKSDLRFVVHYNIPGSLEAYYQEAGRAGRDGLDSRCLLLFNYADRYVQEFFIESAYPPAEVVRQVYEYLCSHPDDPIELTLQEVKERIGLSISAEGVGTCEQLLEKAGVIERLDTNENMASIRIEHDLPTTVDLLPREAKSQRKVLRALEQIVGDRRGERVYFPLRTLLEKSKLEREPLNRALRELSRQSWIDYVPPFRGRAVHFRERGVPFEKLDIDFAKLDERRAAEYAKLEQVIQYASTRRCRQVEILDYFGDPSSQRCGNCDNCFAAGHRQRVTPTTVAVAGGSAEATLCGSSESVARATTIEDQAAIEVVRIALSGVARAKGRVGKLLVAQMLCGSKSSKVKQAGLRSLSTFGLLNYLKQTDVSDLLDTLIRAKWIEQTETTKFRPIVRLTDAGAEVMRGKQPLPSWFRLPEPIAEKVIARAAVERAKSARSEPVSAPSPAFSAEEVSSASPEAIASPEASSNDDLGSLPTHYWTWRLLNAGFSVAECRAIQALSVEQVLDNALRAAEEGRTISPEWFLSAGEIATLETLCGHHRGSPTELLDSLPAEIDLQAARVFLAARS